MSTEISEKPVEAPVTQAVESVLESAAAPVPVPISETPEATSGAADAVTSDLSEDSTTEEEKKVKAVRQVEFYFADSNLPFDKFMWTLHTANAEHWVPIATVASFKRMREYKDMGLPWVVDSLRASTELEVDEAGVNVRRRTEVREPKGQFERSVYAKGFGKEEPGIQRKLEQFFEKYGRVNAVRMRRVEGTKEFKGSVFAEFSDFKSVAAFLNADPKPTWAGEPLLTMSKEDYVDMKIKEKGLTGKSAAARRDDASNRKGFNAFREMRLANGKGKEGKKGEDKEVWLQFMGNKVRVLEEDGGSVKEEDVPRTKGATLKFSGCGGEASFDDIKKPLKERFSRAPFVKYTRGEDSGLVGFDKSLSEEEIAFVRESVKTLNGKPVTWTVAEEDEERTFEVERAISAAKQVLRNASSSSRGRGRGGAGDRGRGGRGRGGRGRGGRGGNGARGGRNAEKKSDAAAEGGAAGAGDEQTGEKRKRAVEPDGAHDTGVRGQSVPSIVSASKKAKVDGDS